MMENRFFSLAPRFSLTWERIFATYFRIEVGVVRNQPIRVEAREIFIFIIEWNTSREEGRGEEQERLLFQIRYYRELIGDNN